MEQTFFQTEALSVGYQDTAVLKDIALSIRPGEIVSLIGPNGAGKTTLLKSLTRQLPPLAGAVYLDGRDVQAISLPQLARAVSVLLTERIRPELMTCWDVVAAGRYPYTGKFGVLGERDREVMVRVMDQVRITDLAHRYFSQCSDGQKQPSVFLPVQRRTEATGPAGPGPVSGTPAPGAGRAHGLPGPAL